ncbi:GNAT family N-acetyltransferase [Actinoplanes sp. CA-131856]
MTASTGTRELPAIRHATGRDLDTLIHLLVTVYAGSGHGRHLIADIHTRRLVLRRYLRIIAAHAITHATVDINDDGQAAAIWYRINGTDSIRIPGYPARLAEATGTYLPRFAEYDRVRAQHQPIDPPHYHLAWLAVAPDTRRHGLATQLLEYRHRQLDIHGTPAYTEATTPGAAQLLARHGYHPRPPYPPGRGAPLLYPMWRPPRTQP